MNELDFIGQDICGDWKVSVTIIKFIHGVAW